MRGVVFLRRPCFYLCRNCTAIFRNQVGFEIDSLNAFDDPDTSCSVNRVPGMQCEFSLSRTVPLLIIIERPISMIRYEDLAEKVSQLSSRCPSRTDSARIRGFRQVPQGTGADERRAVSDAPARSCQHPRRAQARCGHGYGRTAARRSGRHPDVAGGTSEAVRG